MNHLNKRLRAFFQMKTLCFHWKSPNESCVNLLALLYGFRGRRAWDKPDEAFITIGNTLDWSPRRGRLRSFVYDVHHGRVNNFRTTSNIDVRMRHGAKVSYKLCDMYCRTGLVLEVTVGPRTAFFKLPLIKTCVRKSMQSLGRQ